jgi:hypothetical protein
VVHRLVDPNGALLFAGRYLAGRYLVATSSRFTAPAASSRSFTAASWVRAWQQRHTPEQEQRMLRRPNLQQRIANARSLNSSRQQHPGPPRQP